MSTLSVKLAKYFMNRSGSEPVYNKNLPYSENINHLSFIEGSETVKKDILFSMSSAQYKDEMELPIDIYFPGYNLPELLKGKKILDMGCFCGGKAVAYGERWGCKAVDGMDIKEDFIDAAKNFAQTRENKAIDYNFFVGFGENLPAEDNTYDAIISFDVFEHVMSLEKTISECVRVLKPGGVLLGAFPSYYSFNESHLGFVTKNPIIHWFFSADTLNQAYTEIIEERGEKAYWYKSTSKEPWQKLGCGIGTNGNTYSSLNKVLNNVVHSNVNYINTPVGSRGHRSQKSRFVRFISNYILIPLNKITIVRDYLSHRIVFVLQK